MTRTGLRRKSRPAPRPVESSRVRLTMEALEDRWVPAVDVILEWNSIMLQANAVDHSFVGGRAPEQGGPTLTARAFAMVSAAMYDAYNSIENIGQRYLIDVNENRPASSDAAVAKAARDVLVALYPSQRRAFDAALTQTLARIPNGARENRGVAVGQTVAAAVLAARANDNSATIQTPPYVPNGLPGFHNVDPINPGQGFYAPDYATVTPFVLNSVEQITARRLDDGTPAGRLAFLSSQEYTEAFFEVLTLGGDGITTPTLRTAEQTEIGIFWAYDGARGLGTPPRLYNQIVQTVAVQQGNTVAENARLFALVNLAMHDAGIVAWNAKYDDDFWRPVLGVRGAGSDGNPFTPGVANWTPLGAPNSNPAAPGLPNFTPPFPAYTSGHATFGAATFQTLTRFYGTDDITFTFTSDELNGITRDNNGVVREISPRTFTSFSQASAENAQSRIYLGIHWQFDAQEGIRTGNRVANFTFNNFLRPRTVSDDGAAFALAFAAEDTSAPAPSAEADVPADGGLLPTTPAGAGAEVAPGVFVTTVFLPPAGTGAVPSDGTGDPTAPPAAGGDTGGLFLLPVSEQDRAALGDFTPALRVTGPNAADVLSLLDQLITNDPMSMF